MSNVTRKIKHGSEFLSYAEAADIMDISYSATVAMYANGYTDMASMLQYRKDLKNNKGNSGKKKIIYHTSKGDMTITEIHDAHPKKLDIVTLRNRGNSWGFDHKAMWLPIIKGWRNFRAIAIELDGPPRPSDEYKSNYEYKGLQSKAPQLIDRKKCCTRDKGLKKCKTYALRLKMDNDIPELCKAASGSTCPNYDGVSIPTYTNSSGRPARSFQQNGAPKT